MLSLLKYANAIYNQYVYDIGCDIDKGEFYKCKFMHDALRMQLFCNSIYKKLY